MSIARNLSAAGDFSDVLRRLEEQGLDPSRVISCMPSAGLPGHVPGVRGCNVYNRCPFDLTRFGGFKGEGPKQILYYLKPNDGTRHQKEDETVCFRFAHTLAERMYAGIQERMRGKSGNPGPEMINIIGWEDHPDPKCRQYKKKDHRKVDPNDRSKEARFHDVIEPVQIHPYRHPTETYGDSYEAQLERDSQRRMQEDPDFRTGPAMHITEAEAEALPITERMTDDDESDLPITLAEPTPTRKR